MPVSSDNVQQVVRFLIHGRRPFSLNQIPDLTRVPQGSAYRIVRWFQYHRALVQQAGQWVPDAHRLLDLVAGTRRGDVVPDRTLHTSLDEAGVHRALTELGVPCAMGYLTAANLHLYYQAERRIHVLVPRDQLTRARNGLPDGDRPVELFGRDLDHTGTQVMANGIVATNLLETAIDVRAHPDGGAHADLLLQALTRSRPGGGAHA